MAIKLWGFELKREKEIVPSEPAIAVPETDDGAVTIASGGHFGSYLDLESSYKNEADLVTKYREMAMTPEVETAIDDIVNETIVHDDDGKTVTIILDDLEQPDSIKERIREEFDYILKLLNFSNGGQDLFRQWYIDGRIFYQVVINKDQPKLGIQNLIYLDPRKIKKVRVATKQREPRTGVEFVTGTAEFYIYNEKAVSAANVGGIVNYSTSPTDSSIKLAPDSIVLVTSGLMDPRRATVLSHLHKAIKPLNQLRMLEDATVIYRLSRAPERRVFYIDVGNLPKAKADQYLNNIMNKFRNKVVYDSATGTVRDDRKFMSMLEDFWIPRRGEGKSTEITTLPSGQNLGEMTDVEYFQKKLYKALNVPVSRLEPATGFTLGRSTEITRDELKFTKFVERLRNRFSLLFDELMERQLALKGICSPEDWETLKEDIHYDFLKDNNFNELKEAELLNQRLALLQLIDPYAGKYYSHAWIKKNVLNFDEEEIQTINKEIEQETEEMMQNSEFVPGVKPTPGPPNASGGMPK